MVSTLTDSVCVPALVAIVVEAVLAPHLYLPLKLDLLPGAETALVIITCKGWRSGFCSSCEEFVEGSLRVSFLASLVLSLGQHEEDF